MQQTFSFLKKKLMKEEPSPVIETLVVGAEGTPSSALSSSSSSSTTQKKNGFNSVLRKTSFTDELTNPAVFNESDN